MKTNFLNFARLSIAILTITLFCTCTKSGDPQNTSGSFTWNWNGTNYTGNFKEAFLQSLSPTPIIIAGTGPAAHTAGTGPRISLNSLNAGTYNLGAGLTNAIVFIAPNGDNLQSLAGVLHITQNANSRLSGDFSATLIDPASQTSTLTGSFSNIIINN
ncbi:MAG: hypothetical protein ABIN74_00070 [Ferruginibacter sp.]